MLDQLDGSVPWIPGKGQVPDDGPPPQFLSAEVEPRTDLRGVEAARQPVHQGFESFQAPEDVAWKLPLLAESRERGFSQAGHASQAGYSYGERQLGEQRQRQGIRDWEYGWWHCQWQELGQRTGVVMNEMDKNLAGLFANQVAGVFSVTNQLVVEKKS